VGVSGWLFPAFRNGGGTKNAETEVAILYPAWLIDSTYPKKCGFTGSRLPFQFCCPCSHTDELRTSAKGAAEPSPAQRAGYPRQVRSIRSEGPMDVWRLRLLAPHIHRWRSSFVFTFVFPALRTGLRSLAPLALTLRDFEADGHLGILMILVPTVLVRFQR